MGGLARRASYIKSVKGTDKNLLILDAGNVFSTPGVQAQLKAAVALDAMGMMAYNALNLSNQDFVFGSDFIFNTTQQYQVPTISCNIVYEDTGNPVTESSQVLQFDNFTVGITGVVAKKYESTILKSNPQNPRTIKVLDELSALQAHISELKNTADIVMVLANVGLDRAKEIAREVPDIDIMVCGHGADELKAPLVVNNVYIVKAGYYGKDAGKLVISLNRRNRIIEAQGTITTLDKTIPEDSEFLTLLDTYHKSLKEHKEELFDIEQRTPDSGGQYVSTAKCISCHQSQADQWRTTDHAKAFDSLVAKTQDYNPECVFCHVTGFGYVGGFRRPDLTPELADVQCEMCHGAGGDHAAQPAAGYGTVSEITCVNCHTSERSPNFDYATYYPKIAH